VKEPDLLDPGHFQPENLQLLRAEPVQSLQVGRVFRVVRVWPGLTESMFLRELETEKHLAENPG